MIEVNVELTKERYGLAIGRIREIASDENATEVAVVFADYFKETAAFLVKMDEVLCAAERGALFAMPLEEKK